MVIPAVDASGVALCGVGRLIHPEAGNMQDILRSVALTGRRCLYVTPVLVMRSAHMQAFFFLCSWVDRLVHDEAVCQGRS